MTFDVFSTHGPAEAGEVEENPCLARPGLADSRARMLAPTVYCPHGFTSARLTNATTTRGERS